MSECLLGYMTGQTIFANGTEKPSECTREIFLKLEEIMTTIGSPLLSAFLPQTSDGHSTANEKSKQLSILKACQSYCQSVKYPKSLLENLFRLIFDTGLVEESLFIEWKTAASTQADKKEAVKQVEGWFKWLEQEK
jgi:hypothetical protein